MFSGLLSKYFTLFYYGILLLSCLGVYALPERTSIQPLEQQNQPIGQVQGIPDRLVDIAKKDALDSTPGVYKKADLSFQITGDPLELVISDNFDYQNILIRRENSNDSVIQVSSYMTSSVVQDLDITRNILPPVIKLESNRLKISSPERYTLTFRGFSPDFTAQQFTEGMIRSKPEHFSAFGSYVLYLQIPNNLKVFGNQMNVIYLE